MSGQSCLGCATFPCLTSSPTPVSDKTQAPDAEPGTYIEADDQGEEKKPAPAKRIALPESALGKNLAHADKKVGSALRAMGRYMHKVLQQAVLWTLIVAL